MLNHMKAVDFVIESHDKIVFVEFKDPGNPTVPADRRDEFIGRFLSGAIDTDLRYKFRDTFLYEWLCGRVSKPIYYWILITGLDKAYLTIRNDALRRGLPDADHTPTDWKRSPVESCRIFNIDTWNKELSDYKVARIP